MTAATQEPQVQAEKKPEVDHKKVKVGDILMHIDYVKVTQVNQGEESYKSLLLLLR